jgi:hypothetical protein
MCELCSIKYFLLGAFTVMLAQAFLILLLVGALAATLVIAAIAAFQRRLEARKAQSSVD